MAEADDAMRERPQDGGMLYLRHLVDSTDDPILLDRAQAAWVDHMLTDPPRYFAEARARHIAEILAKRRRPAPPRPSLMRHWVWLALLWLGIMSGFWAGITRGYPAAVFAVLVCWVLGITWLVAAKDPR